MPQEEFNNNDVNDTQTELADEESEEIPVLEVGTDLYKKKSTNAETAEKSGINPSTVEFMSGYLNLDCETLISAFEKSISSRKNKEN